MNKHDRHRAIKEIVASRSIRTQKDLLVALHERGVEVTQATTSRDIAEIPLQRVRTLNGIVYHWQGLITEPAEQLSRILRNSVLSINRSENLVILKTGPGMAAPIAVALDETPLEAKMGTIAGDDTVLVVASDTGSGLALYETLTVMLG